MLYKMALAFASRGGWKQKQEDIEIIRSKNIQQ